MQVSLVALTKPVIPGCDSASEFLAYCARVSNPANQNNKETSARLLKYLIKHQHWSPFEMAHMVLKIVTTRDIARQILRHRSFSFQEFSQRYAEAAFFEGRKVRLQDNKNRQNSLETDDEKLRVWWNYAQDRVIQEAAAVYRNALDRGIAKEVARAVLPEGLTQSVLYMAGSIRSWIHYCDLRTGQDTQKEHREIALECQRILYEQFPALKNDTVT
ncbi:MAG: FAD-dependent thymidylate synthase [Thermoplasmatales archaeon]